MGWSKIPKILLDEIAKTTQNIELIYELYELNGIIKYHLAGNPNTPIDIIEKLSVFDGWAVRAMVAENTKTPLYILENLQNDNEYGVRCGLAKNGNISDNIVQNLIMDKSECVRSTLAKHTGDIYVMNRLSMDSSKYVRRGVLENPKIPYSLLIRMANDVDEYIYDMIEKD